MHFQTGDNIFFYVFRKLPVLNTPPTYLQLTFSRLHVIAFLTIIIKAIVGKYMADENGF